MRPTDKKISRKIISNASNPVPFSKEANDLYDAYIDPEWWIHPLSDIITGLLEARMSFNSGTRRAVRERSTAGMQKLSGTRADQMNERDGIEAEYYFEESFHRWCGCHAARN